VLGYVKLKLLNVWHSRLHSGLPRATAGLMKLFRTSLSQPYSDVIPKSPHFSDVTTQVMMGVCHGLALTVASTSRC